MAKVINNINIKAENPVVINALIDRVKSEDSCFDFESILTPGTNYYGEADHAVLERVDDHQVRYIFTTEDHNPTYVLQRLSGMFNVTIDQETIYPESDVVYLSRHKDETITDKIKDKLTDDDIEFVKLYESGQLEKTFRLLEKRDKQEADKYGLKITDVFNDIEFRINDKRYLKDVKKMIAFDGSPLDFRLLDSEPSYVLNDKSQQMKWRVQHWGTTSNAKDVLSMPSQFPNILHYQFLTDSPAIEAIRKLSELAPSGTVYYTVYFPTADQKQIYEFSNGKQLYEPRNKVIHGADREMIAQYLREVELKKEAETEEYSAAALDADDKIEDEFEPELIDPAIEEDLLDSKESENLWLARRINDLTKKYYSYTIESLSQNDPVIRINKIKKLIETGDQDELREYLQILIEDQNTQGIIKVEAMDILTTLDHQDQNIDGSKQKKETIELAEKIDHVLFSADPDSYREIYGSRSSGRLALYSVLEEPDKDKATETYRYVVTTLRDIMQDPEISYSLCTDATAAYQDVVQTARNAGLNLDFLQNHIGEEAAYQLENGKYLTVTGRRDDYEVMIYNKSYQVEEMKMVREETILGAVGNVTYSRQGYAIKNETSAAQIKQNAEIRTRHTKSLDHLFASFLDKEDQQKART